MLNHAHLLALRLRAEPEVLRDALLNSLGILDLRPTLPDTLSYEHLDVHDVVVTPIVVHVLVNDPLCVVELKVQAVKEPREDAHHAGHRGDVDFQQC